MPDEQLYVPPSQRSTWEKAKKLLNRVGEAIRIERCFQPSQM